MKLFVPYRIGTGPVLMDVPVGNGPAYYATQTITLGDYNFPIGVGPQDDRNKCADCPICHPK